MSSATASDVFRIVEIEWWRQLPLATDSGLWLHLNVNFICSRWINEEIKRNKLEKFFRREAEWKEKYVGWVFPSSFIFPVVTPENGRQKPREESLRNERYECTAVGLEKSCEQRLNVQCRFSSSKFYRCCVQLQRVSSNLIRSTSSSSYLRTHSSEGYSELHRDSYSHPK